MSDVPMGSTQPPLNTDDFLQWRDTEHRTLIDKYHHTRALEAELNQWKTWGIIEIAVRNPSVANYMEHWEGRAIKAEQALAALEAENKRLQNPVTLTDTLTHSRTCSAGHDLDSDCTCGLDYRVQLQTSQTLHAAWIKRASEAEQQVAALEARNKELREKARLAQADTAAIHELMTIYNLGGWTDSIAQ